MTMEKLPIPMKLQILAASTFLLFSYDVCTKFGPFESSQVISCNTGVGGTMNFMLEMMLKIQLHPYILGVV